MTVSSDPHFPKSQRFQLRRWLRQNLFNTVGNSLLTIFCLVAIAVLSWGAIYWFNEVAQWQVIQTNLPLFFIGQFPAEQIWRLWLFAAILAGLIGLTTAGLLQVQRLPRWSWIVAGLAGAVVLTLPVPWSARICLVGVEAIAVAACALGLQGGPRWLPWLGWGWVLAFPLGLWLIGGGLGLAPVTANEWKGLLLTLLTAALSIALSFPLGVLLALGRQSKLPAIRWVCTLYIEVVRGLPLIAILFLALNMMPLFLPPGPVRDIALNSAFATILFAIAGLTLFSAAYLAENVRGGLQTVPREQVEAAKALGLNPLLVTGLVVLPQALRASIPAIVGQFISLFKDTALLSLFGFLELTGISRDILAQSAFIGRYQEVYLFIGAIYWGICYSMSLASRRLEHQLGVGQR